MRSQCDLQTCTQTRTIGCVHSIDEEILPVSECSEGDHRPSRTRICPTSDCLEWHIGQWDGVSNHSRARIRILSSSERV